MFARYLAAAAVAVAGVLADQSAAAQSAQPVTVVQADKLASIVSVKQASMLPQFSPRHRAYDWAVAQRGCWYSWGGTACSPGFDCSGLVYASYRHVGYSLPRTTYEMLASVGVKLRRVYQDQIRRGDLAFYGSGHVELWVRWHWTFGAATSGTRVGYHYWARGAAWRPTAVYRVIDAG